MTQEERELSWKSGSTDPVYGFEERESDDPKTYPCTFMEIILRRDLSMHRLTERLCPGVAAADAGCRFERITGDTDAAGEKLFGEAAIETCRESEARQDQNPRWRYLEPAC